MKQPLKIFVISLFICGPVLNMNAIFNTDPGEYSRSRKIWDRIGRAMMARDMELAESRIDTMLIWSLEDDDMEQHAYALQAKGQMHIHRAEYEVGVDLMRKQIAIFKKLGLNKVGQVLSYSSIAQTHSFRGNIDSAFYYLRVAESELPMIHDSVQFRTHTFVYNDLGMQHSTIGNFDSAAYYHTLQLKYIRPRDTIHTYGTFLNLATVLMNMRNYEEANIYIDKVLDLTSPIKYSGGHTRALTLKADIQIREKKYDAALIDAKKAIEIHENNGLKRNAVYRYATLAQVYLQIGRLDDAENTLSNISNPESERDLRKKSEFYLTSLEVALARKEYSKLRELYKITEQVVNDFGHLQARQRFRNISWKYYESVGQVNTAFDELKSYSLLRDSFISNENLIIVNGLQAKYENSLKEKRIAEQNLELNRAESKQQVLWVSLISLLLLGGLVYWFLKRQSRISSELKESEIQSLKKQNKLIAMQSILSGQEEERKRIAQDLHDSIGTLMSTIKMKVIDIQKRIENVQQINIAGEIDTMVGKAATEIRRISHNMTPVALDLTGLEGAIEDLGTQLHLHGIDCSFSLHGLDSIVEKQKQVIIFRVLQELVNNIGKHAQARNVYINTFIENERLKIEVGDDGLGMSQKEWTGSNGLGIGSIKSRIEYLEGQINMTSNDGTLFTINIPL